MNKQTPFLIRRGDIYNFRISVPSGLRHILGCREITKSLRTSIKHNAVPIALELAAITKRLFYELKLHMADNTDETILELKRLRFENKMRKVLRSIENKEAQRAATEQTNLAIMMLKSELFDSHIASSGINDSTVAVTPTHDVPRLSKVINSYLDDYDKDNHGPMFKKHLAVLPMFLETVGDKLVSELKQSDVNDYFKLIQCLPPRWADVCRQNKISINELAKIKHPVTIAPKTFVSTYKASIRAFLATAITNWQDQGFPTNLTTTKISYRGKRIKGENKQRPFTPEELKTLFNNEQMNAYKADTILIQKYLLPLTGLYTGARVNEICQINPQTDIQQEKKTGIWYFDINEKTEGDARIKKSTKNEVSRREVPIHSELIKRGFLEYVSQIKKSGAKLLFPIFKPSRGKASGEAEKWFRQFLVQIDLRDDSPENKIVGMHAFRSTFCNAAMNAGVDESQIVGHTGLVSATTRGYQRDLSLLNKQKIIEQIIFDI